MKQLKFNEKTVESGGKSRWVVVDLETDETAVSPYFESRARMLSNCVDELGELLLDPTLEFQSIHENTKNLLISAARTRIRLGLTTFRVVAVTESFHDRGHGEMGPIVNAVSYNSNSGDNE